MVERPSLLIQKLKDELSRYKHYKETCGLPETSKTRIATENQFKDKLKSIRDKLLSIGKGTKIIKVQVILKEVELSYFIYYVGLEEIEVEDLIENVDIHFLGLKSWKVIQVFEARKLLTE